jgi:hypothetical protein
MAFDTSWLIRLPDSKEPRRHSARCRRLLTPCLGDHCVDYSPSAFCWRASGQHGFPLVFAPVEGEYPLNESNGSSLWSSVGFWPRYRRHARGKFLSESSLVVGQGCMLYYFLALGGCWQWTGSRFYGSDLQFGIIFERGII